jgi:hypothetical protein
MFGNIGPLEYLIVLNIIAVPVAGLARSARTGGQWARPAPAQRGVAALAEQNFLLADELAEPPPRQRVDTPAATERQPRATSSLTHPPTA